jgi:30S ribosomal protein S31
MGKGDRKSKKGKIWIGSYGNSRNRKALKARANRVATSKSTESATQTETAKPKRSTRKKTAES